MKRWMLLLCVGALVVAAGCQTPAGGGGGQPLPNPKLLNTGWTHVADTWYDYFASADPVKISSNGRYVAYLSTASDITADPDPNPESPDLFVLDREADTTVRLSAGLPPTLHGSPSVTDIRDDGSVLWSENGSASCDATCLWNVATGNVLLSSPAQPCTGGTFDDRSNGVILYCDEGANLPAPAPASRVLYDIDTATSSLLLADPLPLPPAERSIRFISPNGRYFAIGDTEVHSYDSVTHELSPFTVRPLGLPEVLNPFADLVSVKGIGDDGRLLTHLWDFETLLQSADLFWFDGATGEREKVEGYPPMNALAFFENSSWFAWDDLTFEINRNFRVEGRDTQGRAMIGRFGDPTDGWRLELPARDIEMVTPDGDVLVNTPYDLDLSHPSPGYSIYVRNGPLL